MKNDEAYEFHNVLQKFRKYASFFSTTIVLIMQKLYPTITAKI